MDLQPDPPSSITRSLPENDAVARLVLELLSGTEDRVRTPLSDLIEKVERLAGSELSRAGRDAAGEVLFSGRALLAQVDAWIDGLLATCVSGEALSTADADAGGSTELRAEDSEAGPVRGSIADALRAPLREARVLVLDADPVTQHMTLGFLTSEGYRAQAVESCKQAQDSLASEAFDALLVDPALGGKDVGRWVDELRAASANPRLPLIALTRELGPEAGRACQESGMDACLTRPLRPGELDELLRRWLAA